MRVFFNNQLVLEILRQKINFDWWEHIDNDNDKTYFDAQNAYVFVENSHESLCDKFQSGRTTA